MTNNKQRKPLWIISATISLIGTILIGVLVNLKTKDIEENLKGYEDYYDYILVLIVVTIILSWFYPYWRSSKQETPNTAKEDFNTYRNELIEGLEKRYNKRIKAKMNHQLRFELQLQLEYTTEATSYTTIQEEFIIQSGGESTDFDKLFERYDRELKRLMILGHPGAGKSMILLRMGLKLLEKAKTDTVHPIAVIVNLASWRQGFAWEEGELYRVYDGDFEKWLEHNLTNAAGEYGISEEYAAELVKTHQILPLLDGFDEIPEEHRDSCLIELKNYIQKVRQQRSLKNTFPELIVCSRILEYHLGESDAPVFAIAKIQDLEAVDIHKALEVLAVQNDLQAKQLQKILQNQPILLPKLQTAFHVHTALSLTDRETDWWKIRSTDDLLEKYVEKELKVLEKETDYVIKNINHWLSWLAWRLNHVKEGVNFELLNLQLGWADKPVKIERSISLLGSLLFCLFFGLVFGIVFGLIGGLIVGIFRSLEKTEIRETRIWSWKFFTKGDIKGIIKLSLMSGIAGGAIGGFGIDIVEHLGEYLVDGLAIGLIVGLVIGIVESGYKNKFHSLPKFNNPYQRLLNSIFFNIISDFFMMFIVFITVAVIRHPSFSSIIEAVCIFSLYLLSSTSIFKHFFLRFFLYREGSMPLRYVNFLDDVAEHSGLMEKDGGQWRFRHQLIQDYFSERYEARS